MAKLDIIVVLLACVLMSCVKALTEQQEVIIPNDDKLIYYHGRWDDSPGTWW